MIRKTNIGFILSWDEHFRAGEQYYLSALKGGKRPDVFTPELTMDILTMSLEKLLVAYLEFMHFHPENHTFYDLINGIKKVNPKSAVLDISIASRLLALDDLYAVCSPLPRGKMEITPELTETFLATTDKVYNIIIKETGGTK